MESSIAVFLARQFAPEQLSTLLTKSNTIANYNLHKTILLVKQKRTLGWESNEVRASVVLSALSLWRRGQKCRMSKRPQRDRASERERAVSLSLSLYLSLWSLRHSTLLSRPSEKERERSLSTPLALTSFNSQPRMRLILTQQYCFTQTAVFLARQFASEQLSTLLMKSNRDSKLQFA